MSVNEFVNKFNLGDSLELMRKLGDESIDLVVTSPPYNLKNTTGGGLKNGSGGKWKNAEIMNGYADHGDNMAHEKYVAWQRSCLSEMMRIIKDDGAIFYNHKWRVQGGLLQDRHDIVDGFPVRQIIIWQRSGGHNFNDSYFLPTYEVIYLICKEKFKLAPKANAVGDVWKFNQTTNKKDHPAPFPLGLALRCIESTNAKIVLDPFMGSGTVAQAADMLGINWIGFDNSKQYVDNAIRDFEHSKKQMRLF